MTNKRTIALGLIFLSFVGISSSYYFYIGQWKSYVRLFGIVEILVLIAAAVIFTARIVKKYRMSYKPLIFAYGVLCVMQLFPLVGALILGNIYLYNSIIHMVIIILGVFNIMALLHTKDKITIA